MIDYKDHALLLNESYRHWTGDYLVAQFDPGEVLAALNEANFALISHALEADPVFNYGNLRALSLFGYEYSEFLQLPSRDTVAPEAIAERSELSQRVDQEGFVTNYRGTRLTKSGKRFVIDEGVVWQLIDNLGRVHGHAALLNSWHLVDATR